MKRTSWVLGPLLVSVVGGGCSEPVTDQAAPEARLPPTEAGAPDPAVVPSAGDAAVAADAEVLAVRLAPRSRATVTFDDWLDAGELPLVVDAGAPTVTATLAGPVLTLDALRSANGTTTIEVGSATGKARATIEVTIEAGPRAYACEVAYDVELSPPRTEREVQVAEAWSSASNRRFGTRSTEDGARAFDWPSGRAPIDLVLPTNATGSTARHRSGGFVWGSVTASGVALPASFDVATGATTILPWTSAGEVFVEQGGVLAGARWESGRPRAVRCATYEESSCEPVAPSDAEESTARLIEASGTVLGCGVVSGRRRAFERPLASAAHWLDEPASGCLSGRVPGGARIGESDRASGETWGYVASVPPCEVRVDRAWGTRLFGAGDAGVLLGSARDVSGSWRAVSLTPIPPTGRLRYARAPEPSDPDLAHACGHGADPAVPLATTENPATSGTIARTHTNFHVTRAPAGEVSYLNLSNARPGRATLHLSRLVPVRVTDPDGLPVAISFADTTGKCETLLAFVQLDLAKVGTYRLTLGPTPVDDLHIVYERTWVVDR